MGFPKVIEGGAGTAGTGCDKHQDASIALKSFLELLTKWDLLLVFLHLRDLKELPPGIRGRFTEIFVDEVG